MHRIRNILVFGGTGFLGRALLEQLVRRSGGAGGRLVVPTRRAGRGDLVRALPTVEVVLGEFSDAARLDTLFQAADPARRIDAVVNLVGILHGSKERFDEVHVELPRRLAQAALHAGVRRFVHVSALGAGAGDDAPSLYLRSKAAGEAALRALPLELTLLRPSVLFGREDHFVNTFAALQRWLPFMIVPGANALFQPVWVDDVAAALARCLDEPSTIGQTYELAGPEVLKLRQIVQCAGRIAGCERPLIGAPGFVARLQAGLMSLLPGEPLLSADNLDSMKLPNVAAGKLPGLAELGIEPSGLMQIAPSYLAPAQGVARLDPLRAAARR